MSKFNARNIHHTLGYFYVGLIISFAISGVFLNHRQSWHPGTYVSNVRDVSIPLVPADSINDEFISDFGVKNGIDDNLRRYRVDKERLRISYEKNDVEIDLKTGKGTIETFKRTPVLGQFTILHQDTSKWWIYYSDIFGISMAIIAFTGMFVNRGKFGFTKYGWKLAVAGILFPIIFLFLLH